MVISPKQKHLQLKQKKNDLYQFAQSDELMKMTDEDMKPLPRLVEFKTQIEKLKQLFTVITGYEVSEVSMFFAEYKYTDHLLTHEDDLQNRVVAFVYYLNRWGLDWGLCFRSFVEKCHHLRGIQSCQQIAYVER